MKISFTIVISLLTYYCSAQVVDIDILKFKNLDRGNEPIWSSCNEDSAFYKADTLVFTTLMSECCDNFSMKIIKRKVYNIKNELRCFEPPRAIINNKVRTGKIKKNEAEYFIVFYEGGTESKRYKIFELAEKKKKTSNGYLQYYSMILIRVK